MTSPDASATLLAAGERLAQRLPLADLDVAALLAEAGVDGAAFAAAFGDLDQYLVALQQQFMTGLRDLVVQAAIAQTGVARLREGGIAYLDQCLRQHALRSWFLTARRQTAVVAAGLQKQDQAYILILGLEFKALHWPHPRAAGRLFLSALQETGRAEHAAGHALPELRAAVWDFLRHPQAAHEIAAEPA